MSVADIWVLQKDSVDGLRLQYIRLSMYVKQ